MSDEWRVRECVNQMLLYVAFRARNTIRDPWDDEIPFPEPLGPRVRNLIHRSQAMCTQLAKSPGNFAPVRSALDHVATYAGNRTLAEALREQAPWKVGALVGWWVEAGLAVAAWRLALCQDAPTPVASPGAAVDESSDACEPTDNRRKESPEAELIRDVVGRLHVADGEVWPPLWCADHVDRWRLKSPGESAWPAAWKASGECAADYHRHLLDWCGDPHREQAPEIDIDDEPAAVKRWAIDYRERYRDFASACQRLLREECRSAISDDTAAARWFPYHLPGTPEDPVYALRPPVQRSSTPDTGPVARGWRTAPRLMIGRLIAQCCRQLERQQRMAGSIGRALARAAAEWGIQNETFGPVPPWQADAGARGARRDAGRLAAFAALVTAVESWNREPAERSGDAAHRTAPDFLALMRRVLANEDFLVRRTPDAGSGPSRLVPRGGDGSGPGTEGTVRLILEQAGSTRVVDVGTIGPPAHCPDDLLAAVEELDWRSWALRILEQHPSADPLAAVTAGVDWETTKRRLLDIEAGAPRAASVLADAFDELHHGRLAKAPGAEAEGDGGATAWLIEALLGLEQVICRVLVAAESGVTVVLRPPRTPEARISLAAWLDAPADAGLRAAEWEVAWERSPLPFGSPCRETLREGGGCRAVFSAGTEAPDEDLRLLSAPGVVDRQGPPWDAITAPLRSRLRDAVGAAMPPDLATAIRDVKTVCAEDAAADFDRLIGLALKGDRRGGDWIRLMHSDPRFSFACHPAVEVTGDGLSLRRPEAGDALEWRDDDAAVDHDVEVRFATESTRARRILSRGRPTGASAEACAARLVHAVRGGPTDVVAAALALQSATDRHRLFGGATADPAGTAVTVAEGLAAAGIDMGEAAAAACTELTNWCRATGARLVPADWHPTAGVTATGLDVERIEFHPWVPMGQVVVERFGITANDGTVLSTPALFLSAGPAPEGFADVARLAAAVPDDDEAAARFLRCVAEFPKRAFSGQAATAAPGLFDVAWKAVMAAPERADLRDAAAAVQRFLDRSHDMVVFEPRTVTDYQESWLRTRDGRPPHGVRVERLLRPGLRTLDNRLVFPAIVETG